MLIELIIMVFITTMIIMILPMMTNAEKLKALEDYLKGLIEIITNEKELITVLMGEEIIT